MKQGSRRAVIAALAANAGIAAAKFVGWAITGAASMLAEAVHSVADTGNQALLLWGDAAAQKPPTEQHPFGFSRERYFWSFVVSLVLFSLGGLFAVYEGVDKLRHPHAVRGVGWAIGILVVGLFLEGFSFRTAVVEALPLKARRSWWAFVRDTKSPELPVVLLEDLGALTGLVLALAGVSLSALTGDARFDAIGSIAIGVLLGLIAVVLAIEMKSLLIGESASAPDRQAIREALEEGEGVVALIHMRTQHFGPENLLVALKAEFASSLSALQLSTEINRAESRIRERVPGARHVYIEPDVRRASGVDPGDEIRAR